MPYSKKNEFVLKSLYSQSDIQEKLKELALKINNDYQDCELTAVCVLKGSFIFFTDLMKLIEVPIQYEFLGLSSYGKEMKSSGEVRVTLDLNEPMEGKHVLIVEDIVDSGLTLKYIQNYFASRNPLSLRTCSLLVKPASIQTDVQIDYSCFEIGGEFVVGYGIDFNQKYRNLPYLGYLEKEV